jgi:hypothetical protein
MQEKLSSCFRGGLDMWTWFLNMRLSSSHTFPRVLISNQPHWTSQALTSELPALQINRMEKWGLGGRLISQCSVTDSVPSLEGTSSGSDQRQLKPMEPRVRVVRKRRINSYWRSSQKGRLRQCTGMPGRRVEVLLAFASPYYKSSTCSYRNFENTMNPKEDSKIISIPWLKE